MDLGKLARGLCQLGMRDVVRERAKQKGHVTWFRGFKQIGGAWATKDIDLSVVRFLPFLVGIGDHRAVAIGIPNQALVGEQLLRICRPQARRLQCHPILVRDRYACITQALAEEHKLPGKVNGIYKDVGKGANPTFWKRLQKVDTVRQDVMCAAERRCRRLWMGEVGFSPEVNTWWQRRNV